VRPTKPEAFLLVAQQLARLSTCNRRKVGCVLTDKHGRITGCGFNGGPAKIASCADNDHLCARENCKPGEKIELCLAIHAEANALMHCTDIKEVDSCFIWGATPCWECAKLLCNSGVSKVYANKVYGVEADKRVFELFKRKMITVDIIQFDKVVEDRVDEGPLVKERASMSAFLEQTTS